MIQKTGYSRLLSVAIAIAATAAYCILAWFIGNLFVTLIGGIGATDLPRLSRYLVQPLQSDVEWNMLHWQLVAVASLVLALLSGRGEAGGNRLPLVLTTHFGLLLLLLFLNLTGFAVAFTIVQPVIDQGFDHFFFPQMYQFG